MCYRKNVLIEAILMGTYNIPLSIKRSSEIMQNAIMSAAMGLVLLGTQE